ncbi:hypothetical protein ACOLNO_002942 [Vibrio parahaemolyticus]
MIETRYLDFEGIKTKNELAGDLAEYYDLTTHNNEFLDTSNDQEVEDFLLYHSYKLENYLSRGVYRIDAEINQAGKVLCVPLEQFKSAIKEVVTEETDLLITYLTDHNLISTIDVSVCNEDYDEKDYSLIMYKENDKFTCFVFNKDDSTLLSDDNVALENIRELIIDDFENLDLDTNIDFDFFGIEEVRLKDSLELDMLKMNFIDRGFPDNHFLKINKENGYNFYTPDFKIIMPSKLSLDEVDIDLLTLLKRDSEPYQKQEQSIEVKQDEKQSRSSRNRPR